MEEDENCCQHVGGLSGGVSRKQKMRSHLSAARTSAPAQEHQAFGAETLQQGEEGEEGKSKPF